MNWNKTRLGLALLAVLSAGCSQAPRAPLPAPADTVPLSVLEEAQDQVKSVRAELEAERLQRTGLEEQLNSLTQESDSLIHQLMGDLAQAKESLEEAEKGAAEMKTGAYPDEIIFQTGTKIRCRVLGAKDGILSVQLPTGEKKSARMSSIATARIRPEATPEAKVDESWVAARSSRPDPVPAAPVPSFRTDGLKLATFWNIPVPASTQKTGDLQRLLKGHGKSQEDLTPKPGAELYNGVYYLMPMNQAVEILGLSGFGVRHQLGTPGFPQKSLTYYEYKGSFDNRFDKLLMVTDLDNQVVAIQLVETQPSTVFLRAHNFDFADPNWHLFNLVENRAKGRSESGVRFKIKKASANVLTIESEYVNSKQETSECTRLHIGQPIVDLILYLIETKY